MIYDVNTLLNLTNPALSCPLVGGDAPTAKERRVALALFRQFLPLRVLEFGLGSGFMASFLLDNCPFIVDYVGVDLPTTEALYRNRRVWPLLTDGTVKDFHEQLCKHVGDVHRYFDAVIMDANYEYDAVMHDTEACRPFLRGGGLFLWCGCGAAGVAKYLDGLNEAGRNIMVPSDRLGPAWEVA